MRLTALWRYPVKGMAGEALVEAPVVGGQIEGDRRWGVFDGDTGLLLSAKRVPALLAATAVWRAGVVTIALPDGGGGVAGQATTDRLLSTWLARPVVVRAAVAGESSRIELDELDDDGAINGIDSFETQPGSFFDSRSPLHLVNAATGRLLDAQSGVGHGDVRRYRPNLVVDGGDALIERGWVDRTVTAGAVTMTVRKLTERCVVVTRAQPALAVAPRLLRHLVTDHGACMGVYLHPLTDGTLAVGDDLRVDSSQARG